MKKNTFLIAAVALSFFSCVQEPVVEDDGHIVLCILKGDKKVETSSIDFLGEGGSMDVSLSCKGNWTAKAVPSSWLSVSPSSGVDAVTLTIKALVNTDADSRLGAVVVSCGDENKTLTVTQGGTWLELSTNSVSFLSQGGTDTLTLSTNVAWEVKTEETWLSLSPSFGKGNSSITIAASDNASISARHGVVMVESDGYTIPISVIQKARFMNVDTESIHFANEGGKYDVTIDGDGTFNASSDADWLSFEKHEKSLSVIASENATPSNRQAMITVFLTDLVEGDLERTIVVTQDSRYLDVATKKIHFANAGESSEIIPVECNGIFDVRSDVNWLTFEKRDTSFIVCATDNATPFVRNATITVFLSDLSDGTLERTIAVEQDARYLNVDAKKVQIPNAGGESEEIAIDCNGLFDVKSDVDWLSFKKNDNSFIAIATDNATPFVRNATITVFLSDLSDGTLERTIAVEQDARYLKVKTKNIQFPVSGGRSDTITVECNGVFDIKSTMEWLSFEKNGSSFYLIASENTTSKPLQAYITVFLSDLLEGTLEHHICITQNGDYNGYEFVDLGLPSGLFWASMNLGSSSSEDAGLLFAWGETSPKDCYTHENYRFYDLSDVFFVTKYTYRDRITTLEACDDAATVNWGLNWRMPTILEWEELLNHCSWIWGSEKGVYGYYVISKSNGNVIFLPTSKIYKSGSYWSSTLSDIDDQGARLLIIYENVHMIKEENGRPCEEARYCGVRIRPVFTP